MPPLTPKRRQLPHRPKRHRHAHHPLRQNRPQNSQNRQGCQAGAARQAEKAHRGQGYSDPASGPDCRGPDFGIRLRPRSVGIGPVRVGLTWVRIIGVRVVGVRIGLRARVVGVRIVGVGLLFHGKRARLHGCSKIRVRNTSANDILARGRTLGRLARIRHLDAICISSAYETRRERRVRFAFHALSVIHRHKQLGGRNRNCELNGFGLKIVARFGRVCNHTCRSRSIDSRVAALKRDGGVADSSSDCTISNVTGVFATLSNAMPASP